jgi:hypothetical protein
MIGMRAVVGSCRIRRVASRPDRLGSWTSMRMTSGCVSIAVATPCSPSVASRSRYVVELRSWRTIFRLNSLSST